MRAASVRLYATLLSFLVFVLAPLASAQAPSDVFTVVLLPDTQFYSSTYPQIFTAETQWIADNQAALNIRMVIGEGDIVDNADLPAQWVNADAAVKILDNAQVPYTLAIGNHDYDGKLPENRSAVSFNQSFGPARYAAYPWYGGNLNNSNENFYTLFTANDQQYMVLALEFYPRDAVLSWASSVIDSHPDAKVFVVTHSFVFTDGTRQDRCDTMDMASQVAAGQANNPEGIWQKLLKSKPNVIFIASGHLIGTGTAHRTDIGVNGNVVNETFTNFQAQTNGGNGFFRILTFHPSENRIDVTTYSPYLNQFRTTADEQFSMPLTTVGITDTIGSIAGKVRTPTCQVIAGATVSTAGFTATSNTSGVYQIGGLVPNGVGGYSLSASRDGFTPLANPGTANAGFTDEVNFYLTANATAPPCTLSTIDPSVTFCSPTANASVTSPVHVVAGATSSKTVSIMQLYVDGVKQSEVLAKTLDTSVTLGAGTHRLTAQIKDSSGAITKSSISVTAFSSSSPGTTVSITSPLNGETVSSPVQVNATATSGTTVSYLQVYVDGALKLTVNGNKLSTPIAMVSGARRVTVQAKDATGTLTKQTVNITVR